MNRISLNHFKERWREKNRHNTTIAGNVFNINKVYVGNYTYGTINCLTWGCGNEILKIGNLCSIAQEVMFNLVQIIILIMLVLIPSCLKCSLEMED